MSDFGSDSDRARRKAEKKEAKKRKRAQEEADATAAAAPSSSAEAEEAVSEKEQKRAQKRAKKEAAAAAAAAEAEAAMKAEAEAEAERKRKKKEKKEKKRARDAQESPAPAAEAPAAEEASEKKKQKKRKHESSSASSSDAPAAPVQSAEERRAEVLAAGERALQEEQDENEREEADRKERKKQKKERKEREKSEAAVADTGDSAEESEKQRRKREKREKKEKAERESAAASSSSAAGSSAAVAPASPSSTPAGAKVYPPPPPGNTTLLLFYQYVRPVWSAAQRQNAENFTRDSLTRHGCTGRLRCAREGFNATLTGPPQGIRAFCEDLRQYEPEHFANTDFKIVDGLRDNQMLRGLKVWQVTELVTYGFLGKDVAPITQGGTHLSPQEWHKRAAEDNTVLIDVRNANENAIGRFQPLNDASRVLDPLMRVSTAFPEWLDKNMGKLKEAKQIMMYCTGGIRCERASALLVQKGLAPEKVCQLEGGIHKYLEAFPDGGHWIGSNYTFDRRFSHGATAKTPEVVGRCACCSGPWQRYQAGRKCFICRMEVLVCRECERSGKYKQVKLKCFLCGGPKPSYLPDDADTLCPPQPKKRGPTVTAADLNQDY